MTPHAVPESQAAGSRTRLFSRIPSIQAHRSAQSGTGRTPARHSASGRNGRQLLPPKQPPHTAWQTIGASSGGAIWSSGTLTVSNSIFSGNSGATNGGAILNSSGANMATVTDSFFLNNSVSTAPQGEAADFTGGAMQNNGGTFIVSNSTFVGNSAPAGESGGTATQSWGKDRRSVAHQPHHGAELPDAGRGCRTGSADVSRPGHRSAWRAIVQVPTPPQPVLEGFGAGRLGERWNHVELERAGDRRRRFRLTLICLRSKSVQQKLADELQCLGGSCQTSWTPEVPMDHPFPHVESSIDTGRNRPLD